MKMVTQLFTVFMLISMGLMAQRNPDSTQYNKQPPPLPRKYQRSAGDELILSTENFYTGLLLETSGIVLNTVGLIDIANARYYGTHNNSAGGYFLLGTLLDIAGGYFIIESRIHIKRAGIILNRNGVGMAIPLGK